MTDKRKSAGALSRRDVLRYGIYGGMAASLSPGLWLGGCKSLFRRKKPHIIFIVLDTARADRLSCFGYPRQSTPHIDKLAGEGTIYERTYSTCCWTLPSHASLFTGLYPTQAGATSETLQLPSFNTTLAEALKNVGYDTAGFSCNVWVSRERGFGQGFDEFHEIWRPENFNKVKKQSGQVEWVALANILGWLDGRKHVENPFFVFINLNCVHMPYRPPEPYLSRFLRPPCTNEQVNRLALIKSVWPLLAGELKLNEEDFRILSDLYDGEVAFADHCVGQIVDRLKSMQILDNTVVIVTSDHGENLGERGLIDHMLSMYETTLHIPLVIRYPESFPGGFRVDDLISCVDIAPTILDLGGASDQMEKIKPVETSLIRDDRKRRAFVVAGNERPLTGIGLMKSRYPSFDVDTIDYRMRAIRTDLHKFIWTMDRDMKLFDLKNDPDELHDIAETQVQTRSKLQRMLSLWMDRIPKAEDISFLEGQDEESLRALRSLGYIK